MGVEFPFALKDIWTGGGPVAFVGGSHRLDIKSVGVWVDADAFELAVDHSCNHLLQAGILGGMSEIWPYLRS